MQEYSFQYTSVIGTFFGLFSRLLSAVRLDDVERNAWRIGCRRQIDPLRRFSVPP